MKKIFVLALLAVAFAAFIPSANAAGTGHHHHHHGHHHHKKK
jgi:Spy/CpxP family protein refolding chaperone